MSDLQQHRLETEEGSSCSSYCHARYDCFCDSRSVCSGHCGGTDTCSEVSSLPYDDFKHQDDDEVNTDSAPEKVDSINVDSRQGDAKTSSAIEVVKTASDNKASTDQSDF